MNTTTRVELHCHSACSDGALTAKALAEALASDGVAIASLTDHNTVDGLPEFGKALQRREVGFIPGVEITTQYRGREAHLLGYGFDPTHAELLAVLKALRQVRPPEVQSVEDSLRRAGTAAEGVSVGPHAATDGRIEIAEAIAVVHRAGGCAFLAHPFFLESDPQVLDEMVAEMKAMGLDGIEAIYGPYTSEEQDLLCQIADRNDLLVSGGTDFHAAKANGHPSAGIDMPTARWKAFRDSIHGPNGPQRGYRSKTEARRSSGRPHWRDFAFHIVFPAFLSLALFIVAIYAVLLPNFERSLMDRKREMIRELTNSAWSILSGFERDERAGRMSRSQAQEMAVSRIAMLRYGRDGKDYFWLQDMQPRMIMHPYRSDLNGKDVSSFTDPRGVRIFSEFAAMVRRGREGYVEYVWQWKDDPSRLVPKESYIKGFQPWGWIIGTGIYIEDVVEETRQIERSILRTALGISVIVALLLLYVVRKGLGIERERADAEQGLIETTERYRSLVDATSEGTLLVTEGRCRYANPTFLAMVGRSQDELEFLELTDLFPETPDNATAWANLSKLLEGEDVGEGYDAVLQRKDGSIVECVIAASRISFVERSGFILLVKDIRSPSIASGDEVRWRYLERVVERLPVGVFRARASSRGTLIEYSKEAARLLVPYDGDEGTPISLADLFGGSDSYNVFLRQLETDGQAVQRFHIRASESGSRFVAIVATLDRDEDGHPRFIDGIVEDVTDQENRSRELEGAIERLQTSLLFLHEPVKDVRRTEVRCGLATSIESAAALMAEHGASAAVIESEHGEAVGIVTDWDFRVRAVAAQVGPHEPVSRIMSSPVITVPESAQTYEALMVLERRQVGHLGIADDAGRIVGVIRGADLIAFRSYGPIAVLREVQQAETAEEVARQCRKAPGLVKALIDSGASPQSATRMISAVCDAASIRLIALAEERLGPPPVPYAFVALGSHGRQEMTLASDQDNAIIYADSTDEELQEASKGYLGSLADFVCEWLDRAGYPFCPGEVMAKNPRWCQPISVWKLNFASWIDLPEPQQLLEFTVFFDSRLVHGSADLCHELRNHVLQKLEGHPSFYPHFAHSSLTFKPPARAFGRLISSMGTDHSGIVNLKDAAMPIVSFARLYALRNAVEDTGTLERLRAVVERGALSQQTFQEVSTAYEGIMRLRLRQQSLETASFQKPDNRVSFRGLSSSEQAMLNQAFTEIAAIQKKVSYDFLGGTTL